MHKKKTMKQCKLFDEPTKNNLSSHFFSLVVRSLHWIMFHIAAMNVCMSVFSCFALCQCKSNIKYKTLSKRTNKTVRV
uniref:Uncharacterized protein n=1 Tax=Anopheles dirus TaxID=7168 RepID=A0A182NYT8_9DIPT